MESRGDRIRAVRKLRQLTQQGLADEMTRRGIPVSRGAVGNWERGEGIETGHLEALSDILGAKVGYLARGEGSPPEAVALPIAERPNEARMIYPQKLPIFGTAEGGQGIEILSSDPVMFVETNLLAGVSGAYGVLITNESMVPAFRPGDIALVHPHMPARPDNEVVLQRDDNGTRYGIIKTLVRATATEYRLKQWNPEKEFTRSKREWTDCHLVVGKYRR